MFIRKEDLANTEVGLRIGVVLFDENGIADIEPDEFAQELLELGFEEVQGEEVEALKEAKAKAEEAISKAKAEEEAKLAEIAKHVAENPEQPIVPAGIIEAVEKADAERKAKNLELISDLSTSMKGDKIDEIAKQVGLLKYPEGVNTKAEKVDAIIEYVNR